MRLPVPQFIEYEDRIDLRVVSFTFPQFFLLSGAIIIPLLLPYIFKGISPIITFFLLIILLTLAIILGWVKINNKYVYRYLPRFLEVILAPKKYIWMKEVKIVKKHIKLPVLEKFIEVTQEAESLSQEKEIQAKEEIPIKENEIRLNHSLSEYINKAHQHGYNPYDPYINFPIPQFPKRRW